MDPLAEARRLLDDAGAELQAAPDAAALETWRVKYLSRAGLVSTAMDRIKTLPAEFKRDYGRVMNEGKKSLEAVFETRKASIGAPVVVGETFDPTLPGTHISIGHKHPITIVMEELVGIFGRMGFGLVETREIETEFHNFEALNIRTDHPSYDPFDTFYVGHKLVLRSHTSPGQVRTMMSRKPPIRVLIPGRCYRPDAVDATHNYTFHQCEGLLVEEDVTFADLKGMLAIFARDMFGPATKTRFRPSYFPFTEPSAEVDVSCAFCGGKGCPTCKRSGWIEIMGCGMVNPVVFEAVGYDPEKYTGFAFGMGVERIAMLRFGITDIRYFQDNNVRFLEQF